MTTIDTSGTFEDAVSESSPQAQEVAAGMRALIADVYPDAVEVPWAKQHNIGYGIGPKKNTEHFCYIGAHRNHINLGFNFGADLSDPEQILEGTGKKFRHIKLHSAEDVAQPALRALLETAVQERKTALG